MLANRRFVAFLAGSLLASFGGWINFLTILSMATWRFTATPFDLVLLSAALLLPSVVLTRMIDRLVTRYPAQRVIVMALGVTFCTTTALMYAGNFVVFLAVVGLKSAALGFLDPAEMRYVTSTLKGTQQADAFRLLSMAQSIAKIAAPAAGAVYAAWSGNDRTMLLSMFLIAAAMGLMSLSVSSSQIETASANPRPVRVKTRLDGPVLPLLCCMVLTVVMSSAINNQFPLMLRERGFDASLLGVLVSCAAVGGVSGSLLPLREQADARGLGPVLTPAILSAVIFVVIGAVFRLPLHSARFLLGGTFLATGLLGARLRIRCRLYLARHCTDNVAGASAALQSGTLLAQFLAPCGGALLTTYLTASNVFVILGVSTASGLVAVGMMFRRDSRVEAPEVAVTERVG